MIRLSLPRTKAATFCINFLPDDESLPWPAGTGFFVSPDGVFITAAHVVTEDGTPTGKVRDNLGTAHFNREAAHEPGGASVHSPSLIELMPSHDIAILRVPFEKHTPAFPGPGFQHLHVSRRQLEDAEPVYAYGYPLSETVLLHQDEHQQIAAQKLSPRTTSMIVASQWYYVPNTVQSTEPERYALDKALNYGNSGGPILAQSTGHVHGWCSRFQPVEIPQTHLAGPAGEPIRIFMPSLYGIVGSFHSPEVIEALERLNVPLVDA